jgi:hypothetical protein
MNDEYITFEVIDDEPENIKIVIEGNKVKNGGFYIDTNCKDREFVGKLLINLGNDVLERHMNG